MPLEDRLVREATQARDRLLEHQRDLEHARIEYHHAIRRLSAAGGSTREIAEALGLSHQRVHQIVCADEPARERARRLVHLFPRRGGDFFQRFTHGGRQVVVRAQDEAVALGHRYVGTEHLLLALLGPEGGVAASALGSLGVDRAAVVREVVDRVGRGDDPGSGGRIPFTPKAKKALERALREARELQHDHIGVEHVLLGIVRKRENLASEILEALGADDESIRQTVVRLLAA